jgi:hypothetical protein
MDVLQSCTVEAVAKNGTQQVQQRASPLILQKDTDRFELMDNSVVEAFPGAEEPKLESVIM